MTSSLLQFWNKFKADAEPYFHPDDQDFLFRTDRSDVLPNTVGTYSDYTTDTHFARRSSPRLDLSLLPIPYGGNLAKADIIILLLNPGLSHTDYYGEFSRPDYRKALQQNLYQDNANAEYPFIWLNPEFCWHEGFMWWERKLRPVLNLVAEKKFNGSYLQAMQAMSQRLGMVELVPYHSASAPSGRLVNGLPSAQVVRSHVQDTLLPEAQAGKKLLIVTRQAKSWGLSHGAPNVVIYNQHEARGASLGPDTKGGAAILRRLGL